jgi:acetylglutamate kinase
VTTVTVPVQVRERTRAKARVLLEALPFIEEHAGSIVVVKIGGAAMDDPRLARTFAEDVALLRLVGVRPVLVHGGGPQVTAMGRRLGIEPRFVQGQRVTDEETLVVARMVLVGLINQDLVSLLGRRGTPAVGLSGADGGLLRVRERDPALGRVGDVEQVDVSVLEHVLLRAVPVIASIGVDWDGRPYNVNADIVAGAVAAATGASKLVYLSDVPGLMGPDGQLVSEATAADCETLVADGVADGGMIPKLESAVSALRAGVGRAHLVDGRIEHGLILELFTPEGIGTMLVPDDAPPVEVPALAPEQLEDGSAA